MDRSAATIKAARNLSLHHHLLTAQRTDLTVADFSSRTHRADVVVADPPWYRIEEVAFLRAAARILRPEGTLLLATSPGGTRPQSVEDRQQLLHDAATCGFELLDTDAGSLTYTSSPFERCALAAAGLPGVPTDWRRGDLLTFRYTAGTRPLSAPRTASVRPSWREVACGRVRVRYSLDHPSSNRTIGSAAAVQPAVPGGVSRSVSRRSPDRNAGNVWTTGNGIWVTAGIGTISLLAQALGQIAEGRPAASAPRGKSSRRAAHSFPSIDGQQQLLDAIRRESDTLQTWGWA